MCAATSILWLVVLEVVFCIRLGFLSWSRNAAICAGVGATLNVIEGQAPFGHFLGAGKVEELMIMIINH